MVRCSGRDVRNQIGPIEERRGKVDARQAASRTKHAEVIGNEDAVVIGVKASLGRQDVIRRVRDQNCMIAGVERSILLDKIEQVWLLFEVRRNVGIVASEMLVVELKIDDMFDFSQMRIELAGGVRRRR